MYQTRPAPGFHMAGNNITAPDMIGQPARCTHDQGGRLFQAVFFGFAQMAAIATGDLKTGTHLCGIPALFAGPGSREGTMITAWLTVFCLAIIALRAAGKRAFCQSRYLPTILYRWTFIGFQGCLLPLIQCPDL